MVSRIVVILGLLAGSCFGQSGSASTSIYQTIYTNATVAIASGTVPNIGQVGHQVFLVFTNAPAQTCTAAANVVLASLQFSYNNSTWFNFGSPQTTIAQTALNLSYFGAGAYPFVRFTVGLFDTAHCIMSGFYTGSSSSSALATSTLFPGSPTFSISSNIRSNPITIVGGTDGLNAAPLQVCNGLSEFQSGGYTVGTTLVAAGFGPGSLINEWGICSIAATATGTATFKLIESQDNTCTNVPIDITPAFSVAASVPFVYGHGVGLIQRTTRLGDSLCIVVTGGTVNAMIQVSII